MRVREPRLPRPLRQLDRGRPATEPTYGPDLTVDRIAELAKAGDPIVEAVLADAGGHVGRVLAATVNTLNPRRIVLGGELGAASKALANAAREAIRPIVQPAAYKGLEIVHAELGNQSEVLGAAARVLRDDQRVRSFITTL